MTLWFDERMRSALQLALPAALLVLALLVPVLERRGTQAWKRAHTAALALLALLGFGLYTAQNWQNQRYFNPYEFFHYYVGAKYAPELGYTRLYDAALLVDRETGFEHQMRDLANLSAHHGGPEYKRLSAVYAEEAAIRAPFTPERWTAFRADVVFFRDQLAPSMWEQLLHDKGYNATPLWTLVGGALAERVPIQSASGRFALVSLDVLLLLASFALVGWAFGLRAMLFAAALYLTHYCTSHAHFRAAFMRTDWLFALSASMCCLHQGKNLRGGALLAWSVLLRVFPFAFALGPVCVLGWSVLRRADERRRAALRCAAGFAFTGVLLGGASLAWAGGLEAWREFGAKIVEHDQRPASDTIGFKKLFTWSIGFRQDQGQELRANFEERQALWWACQALFVAGLAWLVRRRSLTEALGLAFALVWCLTSPAYYYYAFLVVPLLYCAADLARPTRALGLALIFATSLAARALHGGATFGNYFAFKFSCVIGVLALYLVCSAWFEQRRAPRQT
ncbi:MAG: hypothetical protein EXS08_12660 [Planctomycetes bacterium]|nr:hypothetical protein [Planctomycetota bacterium]